VRCLLGEVIISLDLIQRQWQNRKQAFVTSLVPPAEFLLKAVRLSAKSVQGFCAFGISGESAALAG
jgi:hypothetical protein